MAGTTRFLRTNRIESAATVILNGPPLVFAAIGQWANGSAAVTRASGSWILDGVRPWSLLGGALAARFPAGTRVQAVGPGVLTMTNTATAAGAGTDALTLTPDFTLEEDPNFPMSNITVPRRYIPWHSSNAATGTFTVDLDLALGASYQAFGIMAANALDPSLGTFSGASLYTAATYGGAYTLRATANPTTGYRDRFAIMGSVITDRFARVEVNTSVPFSIGGIWLSTVATDLGFAWWPETRLRHEENELRAENAAREQVTFALGFPRRVWSIELGGITDATLAQLLTVFRNQQRKAILIDPDDEGWEVQIVDGAVEWAEKFIGLNRSQLVLESLR